MKSVKKKNALAEPIVLFCNEDHPSAGGRGTPIIRQSYVIGCTVSGYGTVTINDRTFRITPGTCHVLLPGDTVYFTADADDPRVGYYCIAAGLSLERHLKSIGITSESPFVDKDAFPEIRDWMEKMVECRNREDFGAQLLQTACLYGILSALHRSKKPSAKEHVVERVIGIMEADYAKELNVTQLAREVGMARSYFSTRFKAETGMSPHDYLTNLRMQQACLLLEGEDACSIREVALLVGADPKNFSGQFKRYTGKTPLAYRKENRK